MCRMVMKSQKGGSKNDDVRRREEEALQAKQGAGYEKASMINMNKFHTYKKRESTPSALCFTM
jgi:hypothetical protein